MTIKQDEILDRITQVLERTAPRPDLAKAVAEAREERDKFWDATMESRNQENENLVDQLSIATKETEDREIELSAAEQANTKLQTHLAAKTQDYKELHESYQRMAAEQTQQMGEAADTKTTLNRELTEALRSLDRTKAALITMSERAESAERIAHQLDEKLKVAQGQIEHLKLPA